MVGKRARSDGGNVWLERLKKRGAPEVTGVLLPQPGSVGMALLEKLLLAPDGLGRIVGNSVKRAALTGEVSQGGTGVPAEKISRTGTLLTVMPSVIATARNSGNVFCNALRSLSATYSAVAM